LEWLGSGLRAIGYNEDILITEYLNMIKAFPGLCSLNEWREMDILQHEKLHRIGKGIIDG
jgi:hypothetical protein